MHQREIQRRRAIGALVTALAAGFVLAACARPTAPPPGTYRVGGKTYRPVTSAEGFSEVGIASWYGQEFHGRKTASGEPYDMYARTAAHKLLPLGSVVRVVNMENGRTARARINDRGPFVEGRVIDLSYALARDLEIVGPGSARVRIEATEGPGGTTPPPPALEGPFSWQVGAFADAANAKDLAHTLGRRHEDVVLESFDRGDVLLYRVRVGRFRSTAEAEKLLPVLRADGLEPFLVRRDSDSEPR